jgi:predicted tellurium resistance membrane protein TerC
MRHRDYRISRRMEHHPTLGIGLFFILLGIALLVATNDLLHLGSIYNYFTWETAMIFIGLLLVLNLHFTGGLLLVAGGVWFMLDEFHFATPDLIRTIYWPAVVVLLGLSFIISALFKRDKYNN